MGLALRVHIHSDRHYFETLMSKSRRPELRLARSTARAPAQGRVVHDHRGNAVWDWAIDTIVLAKTSSDELVSKLAEPARLTLEDDDCQPAEWGGDPYNRA
jgi:hypothetical protein